MISVSEGSSPTNDRHTYVTSMSRGKDLMKLALITIVTANLESMRTFYQEVLQIAPQTYRGNYVEFTLEAGTLALWRQPECVAFGIAPMRGAANHSVLIELEVADVDGEYARLKGLQLEWVQELTTQPWGHRAFYVRDPDGNVLNFHTAVEELSR
jgi:catechol 2,3-dioxygenase-like lactoylglutathione lyase family enzyme